MRLLVTSEQAELVGSARTSAAGILLICSAIKFNPAKSCSFRCAVMIGEYYAEQMPDASEIESARLPLPAVPSYVDSPPVHDFAMCD